MKKLIITTVIAMTLAMGCGSEGGVDSNSEKSLFSLWTRTDGSELDLTNFVFGVDTTLTFTFEDGDICDVTFRVVGNLHIGIYTEVADECDIFSSGIYTLNDGVLELCDADSNLSCAEYR